MQQLLQLILIEVFFFTCSTWWGWSTTLLVQFGNDWLYNIFQFFLLSSEFFTFGFLIFFQPGNLFVIFVSYFGAQFFLAVDLVFERISIRFQFISGFDTFLQFFVFIGKLFSILDHLFNVFGSQTILVVGDGDFFLVVSSFILSRNL